METRFNEGIPTIPPSEGDVERETNSPAAQAAGELEIETAKASETVAPPSSAIDGYEKVPIRESHEGERRASGAPDEGAKRRKRKIVPGNLLLASASASGLSGDDDGMFSKKVNTGPFCCCFVHVDRLFVSGGWG